MRAETRDENARFLFGAANEQRVECGLEPINSEAKEICLYFLSIILA